MNDHFLNKIYENIISETDDDYNRNLKITKR